MEYELSSSQVQTLYNNGVPLTTAIASENLKADKLDDNEKFDGTNWSVENQNILLIGKVLILIKLLQ